MRAPASSPHPAARTTKKSARLFARRFWKFLMTPSQPDAQGHFGPFGGRFVPETLMSPLEEIEKAYAEARVDPSFQAELDGLLADYAGRPTPLYYAKRLSESLGGARIYLKR